MFFLFFFFCGFIAKIKVETEGRLHLQIQTVHISDRQTSIRKPPRKSNYVDVIP
uniref:Secreted protein n=1 Tax=Nelumbo nucifera TaxID=4432 RepID=A0A822YRI0_NELNU|nr:TPA_asm: hypothetical protein HUJ06_005882 [Nelumbo nucifera]